jgi:hypothetical protein
MTRAPYRFGQPKPTHCLHGHEYTPDNTRIAVNDTGRAQRVCIECRRRWSREFKQRQRRKSA